MPFVLKVNQGPAAGSQFDFAQDEVRLGRTADNDVVVKDEGASRNHARIFRRSGRYWIEDLGSSHGTLLNGRQLTAAVELKSGDTLSIGIVSFTFSIPADITAPAPAFVPEPEAAATAVNTVPEALQRMSIDVTEQHVALNLSTRGDTSLSIEDVETQLRAPNVSHALAVESAAPTTATAEVPVGIPRRVLPAFDAPPVDPNSAAARYRARREANKTPGGRILYAFSQLPQRVRFVVMAVGILLLSSSAVLGMKRLTRPPPAEISEPEELINEAKTIKLSFGEGDGVTFRQPDLKAFRFEAASATSLVGVLHYRARDISKDEVAISLNGFDLGFVPPDTLEPNRELEVVLPSVQIKKGASNYIVFDNMQNPPAHETWRVSHLWLELLAIPDLSLEETQRSVKDDLERAEKLFQQREAGPDNLFRAWKSYKDAWLKLESMVERSNELYTIARTQHHEMAAALNKQCSAMLLEFQKHMNMKPPNRKKAREAAMDILRYFPTRDHRCHDVAEELLGQIHGA